MTEEQSQDTSAPTALELIQRWTTLVKRAFRFWPVFLGAFVIAAATAYLIPKFLPPVYVSKTVLLYRELIQTTSLLGRDQAPVESGEQRGSRLREMLMSRSNFERIIKELNLYGDIVKSQGMIEAVEMFRKRAQCRLGEDTFAITYEGDDPSVVFNVTKRLADSLVEQTAKYRLEQAESTKSFLETQQQKTKKELDTKEQALAEFLALHPEFAQDIATPGGAGAAGASIRAVTRKAKGLDPAIDALQRQQQRLARRLKAPDELPIGPTETIDPVLAAAVESAQQDVDDAKAALASAQARYTDKHPDVAAAKRRLAAANNALASARNTARTGTVVTPGAPATPVDKEALEAQLARVNENLARVKKMRQKGGSAAQARKSSNWIVNLETEWGSVNRDATEVRDRYQEIQRRLFQANIIAKVEASGGAAQMIVIDPAYKPERPSRRGRRRMGAGAALIVMMLGGLIALALAYLDDRIYDEEDLRRLNLGGVAHSVPAAPAPSRKAHA